MKRKQTFCIIHMSAIALRHYATTQTVASRKGVTRTANRCFLMVFWIYQDPVVFLNYLLISNRSVKHYLQFRLGVYYKSKLYDVVCARCASTHQWECFLLSDYFRCIFIILIIGIGQGLFPNENHNLGNYLDK